MKIRGKTSFRLDDPCPKCTKEKGFESQQVDADEGFVLGITCNNCNTMFHEVYEFAFWEEV